MDKVSVIIPTYRGAGSLARAIDSLRNQTYPEIEIIVVDDNNPASVERGQTEQIIRQYGGDDRLSYIRHPENRNGAAARNTGIAASSGAFIAFLDDDDYYLPARTAKSVSFLETHADRVGVCVGVDIIDETGELMDKICPSRDLTVQDILLNYKVLGTGSNIFLRREAVQAVGGFDAAFARRQDLEFMIRICSRGPVGYLPESLVVKVNQTGHEPGYPAARRIIEQFSDRFAPEIAGLPEEGRAYYADQYRYLMEIAFSGRDKEQIAEAWNLYRQYGTLTIRDYVKRFLYRYGIVNSSLYQSVSDLRKRAKIRHSV